MNKDELKQLIETSEKPVRISAKDLESIFTDIIKRRAEFDILFTRDCYNNLELWCEPFASFTHFHDVDVFYFYRKQYIESQQKSWKNG